MPSEAIKLKYGAYIGDGERAFSELMRRANCSAMTGSRLRTGSVNLRVHSFLGVVFALATYSRRPVWDVVHGLIDESHFEDVVYIAEEAKEALADKGWSPRRSRLRGGMEASFSSPPQVCTIRYQHYWRLRYLFAHSRLYYKDITDATDIGAKWVGKIFRADGFEEMDLTLTHLIRLSATFTPMFQHAEMVTATDIQKTFLYLLGNELAYLSKAWRAGFVSIKDIAPDLCHESTIDVSEEEGGEGAVIWSRVPVGSPGAHV